MRHSHNRLHRTQACAAGYPTGWDSPDCCGNCCARAARVLTIAREVAPHVAWPGRARVLSRPLSELLHVLRDGLAHWSIQKSLLPALAIAKLYGAARSRAWRRC